MLECFPMVFEALKELRKHFGVTESVSPEDAKARATEAAYQMARTPEELMNMRPTVMSHAQTALQMVTSFEGKYSLESFL